MFAKMYGWKGVWDELVSADNADFHVVIRGELGEFGYRCSRIK